MPGAAATFAYGINNSGNIVGEFLDLSGNAHAFLDVGGNFTEIALLAPSKPQAGGINDSGQIVGELQDSNGNGHGFLATPVPEPRTFWLLSSALAALVVRRATRSA